MLMHLCTFNVVSKDTLSVFIIPNYTLNAGISMTPVNLQLCIRTLNQPMCSLMKDTWYELLNVDWQN
jgi:hypothetical protein